MVSSKRSATAVFELAWWAFAFVLAGLVLLPIYSTVPAFPFFVPNFLYVVVAITLTRYLFLLHVSWLRDRLIVQAGVALMLIPLIFYMVQAFNGFVIYFDERGPDVLFGHLNPETADTINSYMQAEYRFFGVWAIMASAVMPFRLIYNAWARYRAGVRS
ncbi:glucan phosphoethanolaminetransferase (alkaline phosphatase superfamily) [Lewinella marina]|uniref:Uncharacterized protein n=1 Tax=Neolewinella marina TaxID=438751 RepID=A0A2G0CDA0_9BACT|nr:hypothetical protein [Neolewinella marina]NJB86841.1 glucan phosphoethanolaminetransferase (alkaline phosphatase superfamily) [Neolewinella marina]PHK97958.1 hypothetical protein CGL56_14190 [Neolewinella marina]